MGNERGGAETLPMARGGIDFLNKREGGQNTPAIFSYAENGKCQR